MRAEKIVYGQDQVILMFIVRYISIRRSHKPINICAVALQCTTVKIWIDPSKISGMMKTDICKGAYFVSKTV